MHVNKKAVSWFKEKSQGSHRPGGQQTCQTPTEMERVSLVWESWGTRNPTVAVWSQTRCFISLNRRFHICKTEAEAPHWWRDRNEVTCESVVYFLPSVLTLLPTPSTPLRRLGGGRAGISTRMCLRPSSGPHLREGPVTRRAATLWTNGISQELSSFQKHWHSDGPFVPWWVTSLQNSWSLN